MESPEMLVKEFIKECPEKGSEIINAQACFCITP
jgi:hypothetical protein